MITIKNVSKQWTKVLSLAFIGGILGYSSNFPLGVLIGTVIIIAAWKLSKNDLPKLPIRIKRIIQIIVGGSIGLTFTNETFTILKSIWFPALITAVINIILALFLALIFIRLLKYDVITALACSAPAGMSEMVLIAEKYNTHIPTVVSIHLFRVVVIIIGLPFIVGYFFIY